MKIAVICANGKAGQLITKEAVNRGLDVTAIVRGENKSAAKKVITKDLFDLTAEDLKGFDAVVDHSVHGHLKPFHRFQKQQNIFAIFCLEVTLVCLSSAEPEVCMLITNIL